MLAESTWAGVFAALAGACGQPSGIAASDRAQLDPGVHRLLRLSPMLPGLGDADP
jgi:hypothetical protein